MSFELHAMRTRDLPGVLTIQALAYKDVLHEDASFFLNRIAASPDSVWVARNADDVLGYLISYPWDGVSLPALNTQASHTTQSKFWFLHDCAVSPQARGMGVGMALVKHGLAYARDAGLHTASLVSLPGAVDYWQGLGYRPDTLANQRWQADLIPYGKHAAYMARDLCQG